MSSTDKLMSDELTAPVYSSSPGTNLFWILVTTLPLRTTSERNVAQREWSLHREARAVDVTKKHTQPEYVSKQLIQKLQSQEDKGHADSCPAPLLPLNTTLAFSLSLCLSHLQLHPKDTITTSKTNGTMSCPRRWSIAHILVIQSILFI